MLDTIIVTKRCNSIQRHFVNTLSAAFADFEGDSYYCLPVFSIRFNLYGHPVDLTVLCRHKKKKLYHLAHALAPSVNRRQFQKGADTCGVKAHI